MADKMMMRRGVGDNTQVGKRAALSTRCAYRASKNDFDAIEAGQW